jgi:predicted nucleic acid-binding protein
MQKLRVYIDTSVIGGCFDIEFSEWSIKLFDEFKSGQKIAVVSDITLDELSFAREHIYKHLEVIPKQYIEFITNDEECEVLAAEYIKHGAITKKSYQDAIHIALATIVRVDVLVSWNFKHIVNLDRIRKYNAVNLMHGYSILEIRNPREILNEKS